MDDDMMRYETNNLQTEETLLNKKGSKRFSVNYGNINMSLKLKDINNRTVTAQNKDKGTSDLGDSFFDKKEEVKESMPNKESPAKLSFHNKTYENGDVI